MNSDEAIQLLEEWVPNVNLRKHMFAVEAAVRAYAPKFKADPDLWGLAGLLHDADWEQWPTEHPRRIIAELTKRGVDPLVTDAIARHMASAKRETDLDKVLFACDELTGLIVATALMYPNKLADVTTDKIIKKLKNKGFAKGVNREDITLGVTELKVELTDHIDTVLGAMRDISTELGL